MDSTFMLCPALRLSCTANGSWTWAGVVGVDVGVCASLSRWLPGSEQGAVDTKCRTVLVGWPPLVHSEPLEPQPETLLPEVAAKAALTP